MKTHIILIGFIWLLVTACSSQAPSEKKDSSVGPSDKPSSAYAAESANVEAILTSELTLDDAITKRRSVRHFIDKALSDEQLLALAWAGQGITLASRGFRTAPSAGAKFPLELYFITPNGVYHYLPRENRLEKQIEGDLRGRLAKAASSQMWMAKAGAQVVLVGVVERTSGKYGERAERYVLIEIGHAAQNILLKAVSMGLGTCPVGAFIDDQLAGLLELPDGWHPYYILCIGHENNPGTTSNPNPTSEEEEVEWNRPRFKERQKERDDMVYDIKAQPGRPGVKDEKVLEAMLHVPRHLFVPDSLKPYAYQDSPLPIGHGQTISQPYIVAYMTKFLEIEEDDRVLEIGTGSGYQAAVLYELTPHVFTIEIIEKLAERASETLDELGYDNVKVLPGDGYYGWEEEGPFDGIIVTCAAGHIPPPLIQQLKPGGRMIVPIGGPYESQRLVIVTKDEDGKVKTRDELPVRFVPMTGRAEEGR
jgi:protein-L-isoaspartate(D-aspartate) O-methyltransferase